MPQIQIGGHQSRTKEKQTFSEVDEEDVERLSKYKWHINSSSSHNTLYGQTNTGGKKIHLHRFIMGLGDYKDDKRIINHIDGNGLNNCKANLEICDTLYNSQSFRRHHGNRNVGSVCIDTSGKRIKKWRGHIIINKIKYQKRFLLEEEAHQYIKDILLEKAGF